MIKFKDMFEKAKEMSYKEQEKLFMKELKKFGVKDLEDLTPKQKKQFFNRINFLIKADNEAD